MRRRYVTARGLLKLVDALLLLVLPGCGARTSLPFELPSPTTEAHEAGAPRGAADATDGRVRADASDAADASQPGDATQPSDASDSPDASSSPDASDSGDGPVSITFGSGADWPWFDGNLGGPTGPSRGSASPVCVTTSAPPNCPMGAVVYQPSGGGWAADTSSIPSAVWIWRGDVTDDAVSDLLFAVFQRTFVLGANPGGTIQIAADDFAEVLVNGSVVGTTGSVTDFEAAYESQSSLATFDLSPFLVPGSNTITVVGQNGPASFTAGECSPCTYSLNTAGVVFGGTLTSEP